MGILNTLKNGVASCGRTVFGRTLRSIPMPVWRRLFPKTALGVCYHMVSDCALPHLKHYPFLDPAAFEADLDYLQGHFEIIPYEQLCRVRGDATSARNNALVLTFDDGFAECASVAAPILRRRRAGGVFFVITDLIDNTVLFRESEASLCIDAIGRMPVESIEAIVEELGFAPKLKAVPAGKLSESVRLPLDLTGLGDQAPPTLQPLLHWLLTVGVAEEPLLHALAKRLGVDADAYLREAQPYLTTQQIRQLHADGFTIGAHGRSHRWLQDLSPADAESEIVESCTIIRTITGQSSVPFAFPYFGGGLDRKWLAQLRRRHDVIGLFFDTDGVREDESFVVQRVFGERFGYDRNMDGILRRAWARPAAWGLRK